MQPAPGWDDYLRRRVTNDLGPRTRTGAIFCMLGCAITCGVGGYFAEHPVLSALYLAAFGLLSALRWRNGMAADADNQAAIATWSQRQWWLLYGTSLAWCLFILSVGLLEQQASTALFTAAMVTVAFTTATAESLALTPLHALRLISLQQLPAYAVWALQAPALRPLVLVLIAFVAYQVLHVRRRSQEYLNQVGTEHRLLLSQASVERLAREDALSGLANRRAYEQQLSDAWSLAKNQGTGLGLIILDLDHFKHVNDERGHPAGDACIRHVAGLLTQRFDPEQGWVARTGGEEFAVVLPGADSRSTALLAEAARADLEASPCIHEGQPIALTLSGGAGCADWQLDANPHALISRVDRACYAAKSAGRNRVIQA